MELYAKGQLSFLILNCLLERDFYGLDIISGIYDKSNGNIQLKKPSVYSNLTRMEKQGLVSSYLKSSDLGPNRKYYSITEEGRNYYNDLKNYFERNNIDVFRDFKDDDNSIKNKSSQNSPVFNNNSEDFINQSIKKDDKVDNSEEDDFFDFSSIDDNEYNSIQNIESEHENKKDDTKTYVSKEKESYSFLKDIKQMNEESFLNNENETKQKEIINNQAEQDPILEIKKDDAVFLTKDNVSEYNKRLYDISKEINKYKKKRSFAEDQISMTVDSPLSESIEKTKANIEDFKNSIIETKNKFLSERISQDKFFERNYKDKLESVNKSSNNQNELKEDDAKFITQRVDTNNVERAKKIEPPRLKILVDQSKEGKLPAPKRDTSIDPSHKEILSRLYSKTKDMQSYENRSDSIYDYADLKDFYKNQNISFNVYKKSSEKTEHNTNKLLLLLSLMVFSISSLVSLICFFILMSTNKLNYNTNFLYILLPALTIIDIVYKFYNFKKYKGWLPSQMMPQWQIWTYFILSVGCVIGLNFIFGLNTYNFELYATTLILPILILFIIFIVRYYLKRFIIIKFWR